MNIVIVDDERVTLKWLKHTIEDIHPTFNVVGAFFNGEEAFEYCKHNQVDVLFSDIRMPRMNGMKLLEMIRKDNLSIQTILLSAYDDFSYAREALRLGACEYLLKPEITKEILADTLSKVKEKLAKDTRSTIQPIFDESHSHFINILEGTVSSDEMYIKNKLIEWKIDFDSSSLRILLLYYTDITIREHLCEILSFFLKEEQLEFVTLLKESNIIIVLHSAHRIVTQENLAKNLYTTLTSFFCTDFYLSSSSVQQNVAMFPVLYKEAWSALRYRIFYYSNGCILYDNLDKILNHPIKVKIAMDTANQVLNCIGCNQFSNIPVHVTALLDVIEKYKISIDQVKRIIINVVFELFLAIKKEDFAHDIKGFEIMENIILSFEKNFVAIRKELLTYVLELKFQFEKLKKSYGYSDAVKKIITFIQENYQQPISLEEISHFVYLNRTYI